MLKGLLSRVVGDSNEREIRKLLPIVEAINAREPELERFTPAEFGALTDRLRARVSSGETLDSLLVEAFAAAREAAKRTVSMRPFDVQLVGGIVLHQGKVAEMRTGEGKTLVATLPLYLNSLGGKGAHLVTVNDYLARRDTLWMGPIYHLLGLSLGLLQSGADQPAYLYDPGYQREPYPGLRPVPRAQAYAADITYGTNNEFGFDYLRDNLALSLQGRVQRTLVYAIVDEVDNIFIDEARTPLIISGPSDEPVEEYGQFAAIARQLEAGVHYELDEKERAVFLTDEGLAMVERETGIENIYDEANYRYVHYMQQALKAQVLFQEGRDYLRQRKRIVLIDPHTGRLMPDRRLSEGLHQAIEAKEGVPVLPRDVTSATITIQNYFRMYEKLAGMSGTAVTESEEFFKIYKLDVLAIPTNQPMIRIDNPDVIYRTEEAKLRAVAREILACHSQGQPVLVGTTSVEMSERLSARLNGERLQMAALAPRVAYALQDADLDREERARLRETMNASLETINTGSWRKLMRDLELEPTALSAENLDWIADYLQLPDDGQARHGLERALREGIAHQVLNAKEHTREAGIIARAGEPGTVTIATNMAGRGVDIRLGGELTDEVIRRAHQTLRARGLDPYSSTATQMDSAVAEVAPQYAKARDRVLGVGGLHILGTERHEARRIDNQLRGRSGRQGEPGSSRFYLSLEDDLMRRFGRKEMLSRLMETIGDDFPIEHGLVTKTIERAQTSVEGYNFDIRKHLLEYDDVLNKQRDSIYSERLRVLRTDDVRDSVWRMFEAQVGEHLAKSQQDSDQRRQLFAWLDDALPLTLPAPSSPFQGAVAFGGHLTAFPPFTVSFLANQLAGRPQDEVEGRLRELARETSLALGSQIREAIGATFKAVLDKYEENLDRYRSLLEEKTDDYVQLSEERGEAVDPRRLGQHLERTYPLKLSTPRELTTARLDDLRKHWLAQIEDQFHHQTCAGLIDRGMSRLPAEAATGLDRVRPSRLEDRTLLAEIERVRELAAKQSRSGEAGQRLAQPTPTVGLTADGVLEFLDMVKGSSDMDFGRLDRLVAHVLGAQLDELIARYQAALPARPPAGSGESAGARLRNELERLREAVTEGKRGGRVELLGLMRQLNDLVHVELPDLERVLSTAAAHQYDKWAQRQLNELEADAARSPLGDASWASLAQHLLATQFTERLAYDREHRRQVSWLPRLPLALLADVYAKDLDAQTLQNAILETLQGALELRESTWGREELERWRRITPDQLDTATHGGLMRYLGATELGELRDDSVADLPADTYELLCFILAVQQLQRRPLSELPHAEEVLALLGETLESSIQDVPVVELPPDLQDHLKMLLRRTASLQDQAARMRLMEQPIRQWDRRTLDLVAAPIGGRWTEAHKDQVLTQLEPRLQAVVSDFLRRQRRFVDEERVQRFLVHDGLFDLPSETRQLALQYLARARLERLSRRKISNLDVTTRQRVLDSLQRLGLLTDTGRRSEILSRKIGELDPGIRHGFGVFLARRVWDRDHPLGALDDPLRTQVLDRLREMGSFDDPARLQALPEKRLHEIDADLAASIQDELVGDLRSDLASKTMMELPEDTRREIHRILTARDYFIDEERASWYERKTLAQLPTELLVGLEQNLGQIRLTEKASTPFRDLPAETQSRLLAAFDAERILADRADRLRLTQTGCLADLRGSARSVAAGQLGRQWLVQIRDRRPPELTDSDRQTIWSFLRDKGYFSDKDKEELFTYMRLDEFGPEVQHNLESRLIQQLEDRLENQKVGELPLHVQARIQARLKDTGHFLDPELQRQVENLPPEELAADLRQAVESAIGALLLTNHSGSGYTPGIGDMPARRSLEALTVADLPGSLQEVLWNYLDETGYFLDDAKRSEILERRLADLSSEALEQVARDMAGHLETDIGRRPVSELDDELRQGLREAVEAQGYFESPQQQAQVLAQRLGALPRADLDALAPAIGQALIDDWAERRITDLPPDEQQAILGHLEANDWFLDRTRFEQALSQPLRQLSASLPSEFIDRQRRDQIDRLRSLRLADLGQTQRKQVYRILLERGLRLDESQMRLLRSRQVKDLEPEAYSDLLRYLGTEAVEDWERTPIQDLGEEQKRLVAAYVGRRIMSRIERRVLLFTISRLWVDYLTDIEDLRRGIGLEAYGQRDPLVEYKRKAFELFEELTENVRRTVVRSLFRQAPEPLSGSTG